MHARNLGRVPTPPRPPQALLVVGAAVAALVLLALVIVNVQLFVLTVDPTSVGQADAVVVLAGGDGERLDHGLRAHARRRRADPGRVDRPDHLCNADPRSVVRGGLLPPRSEQHAR